MAGEHGKEKALSSARTYHKDFASASGTQAPDSAPPRDTRHIPSPETIAHTRSGAAQNSILSSKDRVFDVSRAFETGETEGTIITDRRQKRRTLGSLAKDAFSQWFSNTKGSVEDLGLFVEEPEATMQPVKERVSVIEKAAKHAKIAPRKDDHAVVTKNLKTIAPDVTAPLKPYVIKKEEPAATPTWGDGQAAERAASAEPLHTSIQRDRSALFTAPDIPHRTILLKEEDVRPEEHKEEKGSFFSMFSRKRPKPEESPKDPAQPPVKAAPPTPTPASVPPPMSGTIPVRSATASGQQTAPQTAVPTNLPTATPVPPTPGPTILPAAPVPKATPAPPAAPTPPAKPPMPIPGLAHVGAESETPTPAARITPPVTPTVPTVPPFTPSIPEPRPTAQPTAPIASVPPPVPLSPTTPVVPAPEPVPMPIPAPPVAEPAPSTVVPDSLIGVDETLPEESADQGGDSALARIAATRGIEPGEQQEPFAARLARIMPTNTLVIGVVVVIAIFGGIVTAIVVFSGAFSSSGSPTVRTVSQSAPQGALPTSAQTPVPLTGDRGALLSALDSGVKAASAETTMLYPATSLDGVNYTTPASPDVIFASLAPRAPGAFIRSLQPGTMFGAVNTTSEQPFLVLRSNEYDVAFAGMLAWEPNMVADLAPLFGTPVAGGTFVDRLINNTGVRILYDQTGAERVVYGFVNQNTIVITTTSDAFSKLRGLAQ